jgi:diacylglycerol kinase family enzyme
MSDDVSAELSRIAHLDLVSKIYARKHLDDPRVTAGYADHVKLTADPPTYVEGDSELVGLTPQEVEVFTQALQVAGARRLVSEE